MRRSIRLVRPSGRRREGVDEWIGVLSKGRLTDKGIMRMLTGAEQYADAYREALGRVEARNRLESYIDTIRSSAFR